MNAAEIDAMLCEEYIGQIPEFEAISKCFDAMLKKAKENPNGMNPNKWKENRDIQKIFKHFFGLKSFWLYWVPSDVVPNARTFMDSALLGDDQLEAVMNRKKGRGFYDTQHKSIIFIVVYCAILRPEYELTGRELTAIILHECGHNFDSSPYSHLGIVRKLYIKYYLGATPVDEHNRIKQQAYDYYKKASKKVYGNDDMRNSERESDQHAVDRYTNPSTLGSTLKSLKNIFKNTIGIFSGYYWLLQLHHRSARKAEQFADSFAVTYGYGHELITSLEKMDAIFDRPARKTGPVNTLMRDLYRATVEVNSMFKDEHATNQARCKDCIVKLKADVASGDYAPELKDDLLNEIAELEDEYQVIVNCNPEQRISFTRGWRKFINALFGGRPELTRILGRNQM